MNELRQATKMFDPLLNTGLKGFDSLVELALDLHCSWNHAVDEIWKILDPELWELTHNPWVVLQTVSKKQTEQTLADPVFRKKLDALLDVKRSTTEAKRWFQQKYPATSLTCVAYFCMEFMLSEALPIYSGGLGNVAGDQLKAASDLGVPVIGVGLLYQQGYFRQVIGEDGAQQALFPYNDPGQLPIVPLRKPNGEWLRLEIKLPGYSVWLRAWQVEVGRIKLFLLDSNDIANIPIHRGITSELYGGGAELRLKQELLLGIGGWRLLSELGIKPEVCHLNEGHAAFAVLERALEFMQATGLSFNAALATTRAGNLFTTHTAVDAGFDRFTPALIKQYLGDYAENKLGISLNELLSLGRQNPNDSTEPFNMAYLAIRGSGSVNGVSRLHGKVSRKLFEPLFPQWPEPEVPVGYITNGVHMPSWDSAAADELWTNASGKGRWLGTCETLTEDIRKVSDLTIWQMRKTCKASSISYVRERLSRQLALAGETASKIENAKHLFNNDALTIGFARRFATYKRPNLLLHDKQKLFKILTNPRYPVQLFIAGKAHPADIAGQNLIKEWIHFIQDFKLESHVIFLSDYDMHLAEHLVQGADVWINTPRRPWEASGTSGMKVLVNGGVNLSELDGWWAEAYTPQVGWALGDGLEHGDDPEWDNVEAHALYCILENEVIPEFYSRDDKGIPKTWINRIRESMAQLTPRFSATRSVREYTEKHYLPALAAYQKRCAEKGKTGLEIANWRQVILENWAELHFGELKVATNEKEHRFEIQVYLNKIETKAVRVELYANGVNGSDPQIHEMTLDQPVANSAGGYVYIAKITRDSTSTDYTPRVIPHYPGALVPLEETHIRWRK